MISIGGDYNATSVCLAVLNGEKVEYTFTSHDMEKDERELFWSQIRAVLKSISQSFKTPYLYIEDNWVRGGVRPYSGLQLTRMSAFIETAAFASGLTPVLVMPQSWRKIVYGQGRPKEKKELARKFVLDSFHYETKFKYEHNMAEAICLAHYGNLVRSENE